MAADSLKHSIGRDCPRISEVWRAKYWYRGNNACVFDEIADARDIALDDCFRFQSRALRAGLSGSLRAGWNTKCTKCGERNGGDRDCTDHVPDMARPQRIRLEVADSIWSAAVMTLAFIS
jgi:hypothetical protein